MEHAPRQLVTTTFRAMNTQIEMQLAIDAAEPGLAERTSAAQADILAKLLLLVAPQERDSLSPWHVPTAWLLVLESGRVLPSTNLRDYISDTMN